MAAAATAALPAIWTGPKIPSMPILTTAWYATTDEGFGLFFNDILLMRLQIMIFICYPRCTTCQKALKWLNERGIKFETRNIKENNPTYDELKEWLAVSALPVKRFFNTSGQLYKTLNIKDKLPSISQEEALKLLATDGMLVKRPLLIGSDFVLVGFKEEEWREYPLPKAK
jgi:arsenate reductase